MAFTASDILKIVAAIILPPLGVFLEKGVCDVDILINILLTILGYIPGIIHGKSVVRHPNIRGSPVPWAFPRVKLWNSLFQ
jgi:uncharacterized membrane protein YqaE (UPF0057 family)